MSRRVTKKSPQRRKYSRKRHTRKSHSRKRPRTKRRRRRKHAMRGGMWMAAVPAAAALGMAVLGVSSSLASEAAAKAEEDTIAELGAKVKQRWDLHKDLITKLRAVITEPGRPGIYADGWLTEQELRIAQAKFGDPETPGHSTFISFISNIILIESMREDSKHWDKMWDKKAAEVWPHNCFDRQLRAIKATIAHEAVVRAGSPDAATQSG